MPNAFCYKYILRAAYLTIAALFLFTIDISAEGLVPALNDSGFLQLVNADNPLPASYVPRSLTLYNRVRVHPVARDAFIRMQAIMECEGIYGLHLHSAYRDYTRQKILFTRKTKQYKSYGYTHEGAEALAAFTVQRPGASEHQTGLALDVSTTGQLTQSFGDTKAGEWLAINAHRFGFVIRYPLTKTHITHIIYEPWHLRYVGVPHAAIIYEHGLVLEEYTGFLMQHPSYIYEADDGERYLVLLTADLPDPIPDDVIDVNTVRYENETYYVTASRINHPLLR
ncbi:MAG: M15 family metallopeptidase [Defluviitaleaceae bacterium]|nr:M15 family metallopeptidase [Defluviitaleaceae bacterium]